jgi:hypothetical protein
MEQRRASQQAKRRAAPFTATLAMMNSIPGWGTGTVYTRGLGVPLE